MRIFLDVLADALEASVREAVQLSSFKGHPEDSLLIEVPFPMPADAPEMAWLAEEMERRLQRLGAVKVRFVPLWWRPV